MPEPNVPNYVGEAVGIEDIYVAPITKDNETGYTAGATDMLAPTATMARDTTTSTKTRYYSNKPLFVDTAEGETKVTLQVPGLTVKKRAELLGKFFDAAKGTMIDTGENNAPFYALGFKINRPDGIEEGIWFLKGRFSIPKEEAQTKTEGINEKPLTIEFTAVTTMCKFTVGDKTKSVKAMQGDSSDPKFKAAAANWLKTVQTPAIAAIGG